jgi:glutamate-1-semialdehyde 2,1-aminomutase
MLITDEVRSGFRVARDGIWDELGAPPDLSAWGKAIANGHCLSALLGNARARPGIEAVFVTGSYWFQSAALAASLVVMGRIKDGAYLDRINATGGRLRAGLDELAARHGVGFEQSGPVTMPLMTFTDDPDFRAGFFWCTEMLKQGVYMHPWHNMFINTAMTEAHLETTLKAADKAFAALKAERATLPPNTRLFAASR